MLLGAHGGTRHFVMIEVHNATLKPDRNLCITKLSYRTRPKGIFGFTTYV